MSVYKRGGVYWMRFCFEGRNIQRSTRLKNRREAEDYEAVIRSRLVRDGLGVLERKSIPTLREFSARFAAEIAIQCAPKPRTVQFYAQQMKALLDYPPLADAKLNAIDADLLSRYVAYRSELVSAASVNRSLATLRRALRMAQEWRLMDRLPRIRLLKGERSREYVLSRADEMRYLAAAPQPLRDVSLLVLNTGLRLGEALGLRWSDVHMQPVNGSRYGYLRVREGKSIHAQRSLPLTSAVRLMLEQRRVAVQSIWIFPTPDNPGEAYRGTSLDHMHAKVRRGLGLSDEFVLHSLRHTMLSRLGESGADAFTIQRVAGHHSVVMSQRYVHPSRGGIEASFERFECISGLPPQESQNRQELVTNLATLSVLPSVSY
jgi:integrase